MNSLHSYSYQSPPPKFTLKCLESKKKNILQHCARISTRREVLLSEPHELTKGAEPERKQQWRKGGGEEEAGGVGGKRTVAAIVGVGCDDDGRWVRSDGSSSSLRTLLIAFHPHE